MRFAIGFLHNFDANLIVYFAICLLLSIEILFLTLDDFIDVDCLVASLAHHIPEDVFQYAFFWIHFIH
jgi:hypothetical protein